MTMVLSAKVDERTKDRVARFARARGFVHPSRRPNLSAATREILDAGLRVVEGGTASSEANTKGGSDNES